MIMLAGLSVISAGAFSMAAGAYSATCAEYELDTIREAKRQFLSTGEATVNIRTPRSTLGTAVIVGCVVHTRRTHAAHNPRVLWC